MVMDQSYFLVDRLLVLGTVGCWKEPTDFTNLDREHGLRMISSSEVQLKFVQNCADIVAKLQNILVNGQSLPDILRKSRKFAKK
ncbi:unnamed protein product [Caenorhabditis nigoni]